MPARRGTRPLKAWIYAGVYGPELMACAATVRIGPLRQAFWAVWDRAAGRLEQGTLFVRRDRVTVTPTRLRIAPAGLDLALSGGAAIECVCPSGAEYAWTRKTAGVRAVGSFRGRPVDTLGVVDESAGYHTRHVDWRWSAGVGRLADGRAAAWNLVTGINDPPTGSERAIWIDGVAEEPAPVVFAPGLTAIAFADGAELRFAAEARRARRDELGLLASDYEQPFGTFSGTLPGGLALAEGFGVMERHRVRW
jgi:hypothetical protein